MNDDNSCLSLHATAALVIHWGYPAFSQIGRAFVDQLDLSDAKNLIIECESGCPWYGEVIANRKATIRDISNSFITASQEPVTLIIPAAGWSPLALELVEKNPTRLKAIEFDIAGMKTKEKVYQKTSPDLADHIRCITADISEPSLMKDYLPPVPGPLLVILEGISYFMPDGWMDRLIKAFSRDFQVSWIIEYLLPEDMIKPDRANIAEHVFSVVGNTCNSAPPVRYSPAQIQEIGYANGYSDIRTLTVREMEWNRTGKNHYFPEDTDGWIAISTLQKLG